MPEEFPSSFGREVTLDGSFKFTRRHTRPRQIFDTKRMCHAKTRTSMDALPSHNIPTHTYRLWRTSHYPPRDDGRSMPHCNLRVAVTWPLSKADVSHRCHKVSQSRQWCCAKMLVRETATSKIITKGKRHCIPSRPSSTCRQMPHEAAVLDTILTPHTPCRTMDMQPPATRNHLA